MTDTIGGVEVRTVSVDPNGHDVFEFGTIAIRSDILSGLLTFDQSPSALLGKAVEDGFLTGASPVDGRSLTSSVCIVIRPSLLAYRFVDDAHGLIFYLIVPVFGWAQVRGVYFPGLAVNFVSSTWPDGLWVALFQDRPERLLSRHIAVHARQIRDYIGYADGRRPALIFTQGNIAHHLCNEIGEIERLSSVGTRVPEILLMGGARAEHYGRLERLYPRLRLRVKRGLQPEGLARYVYRRRLCVFGPSNQYVSQDLSRNIIDYNTKGWCLRLKGRELARLQRASCPIVVFGLRAQNRTLTDPVRFFSDAARFILDEAGQAAIVFDGWSSKGVTGFARVEKDIVRRVREAVPSERLTVIDTVGRPMHENLFWIKSAHFFIAVYGAGMVKYRWLCNKQGLMLSGRWNLQYRTDLHIYDSDRHMESPAPMITIRQEDVEDVPEAGVITNLPLHPDDSLMNFRVNMDAVYADIRTLLRRTAPPRVDRGP